MPATFTMGNKYQITHTLFVLCLVVQVLKWSHCQSNSI